MVEEAYAISRSSSGGFTYEDLRQMPFDDYGALVDVVIKTEKKNAK